MNRDQIGHQGMGSRDQPLSPLSDEAFALQLQRRLRAQENDLDFVTRSRLAAARARAVEQVPERVPGQVLGLGVAGQLSRAFGGGLLNWRWTVPGAAIAALALALVLHAPQQGLGAHAFNNATDVAELFGLDGESASLGGDADFYQMLSDIDTNS